MVIVPIVIGPTGVGKTEIVLRAVQNIDAEIISADSRQIYRYMDIGTAKPTIEQRQRVPHHLVDCVDPKNKMNAVAYGRKAREIISRLLQEGKLPVVVGGSGLYLRALLGRFFEGPGADPEIRKRLEQEEAQTGPGSLYRRLMKVDPQSAGRIHTHDLFRTIRALEVHEMTGISLSRWQERGPYYQPSFSWCKIGLFRQRESLYRRIDVRADKMISQGLMEEVRNLLGRGYSSQLKVLSNVGYQEMIAHLEGRMDLKESIARFKQKTRQYAKRQMTWFGKDQEILWFQAEREQEQLCLSIQRLKEGEMPEAKEFKRRKALLQLSWSQQLSKRRLGQIKKLN